MFLAFCVGRSAILWLRLSWLAHCGPNCTCTLPTLYPKNHTVCSYLCVFLTNEDNDVVYATSRRLTSVSRLIFLSMSPRPDVRPTAARLVHVAFVRLSQPPVYQSFGPFSSDGWWSSASQTAWFTLGLLVVFELLLVPSSFQFLPTTFSDTGKSSADYLNDPSVFAAIIRFVATRNSDWRPFVRSACQCRKIENAKKCVLVAKVEIECWCVSMINT